MLNLRSRIALKSLHQCFLTIKYVSSLSVNSTQMRRVCHLLLLLAPLFQKVCANTYCCGNQLFVMWQKKPGTSLWSLPLRPPHSRPVFVSYQTRERCIIASALEGRPGVFFGLINCTRLLHWSPGFKKYGSDNGYRLLNCKIHCLPVSVGKFSPDNVNSSLIPLFPCKHFPFVIVSKLFTFIVNLMCIYFLFLEIVMQKPYYIPVP